MTFGAQFAGSELGSQSNLFPKHSELVGAEGMLHMQLLMPGLNGSGQAVLTFLTIAPGLEAVHIWVW